MKRSCAILTSLLLASSAAQASLDFLPSSRHHRLLTYALFTEEHSALLVRSAGRAWGTIGGGIALIDNTEWRGRPQLVLGGSVNGNFRDNPAYAGLLTETIDARVSLALETELSESLRVSLGWAHASGHGSDSVNDPALLAPNLGDDWVQVRVVYDWDRYLRIGGTVKAVYGSDPTLLGFASDQFVELFPIGSREDERGGTPFVSLGFEQGGRHRLQWTTEVQAGLYFGSHLSEKHSSAARALIGYYNGTDPALKYAQFQDSRVSFGYFGVMFDF